jgi:hypothetical protein
MQPFLQDQRQILAELASVVGISRVSVHRFQGVPGREGNFVQRAPHLLLSDLSATPLPDDYVPEPVFLRDWLEFAAWLANDLQAWAVALTPLPVGVYPPALRQRVPVLSWDRSTSVQSARRALAGAI